MRPLFWRFRQKTPSAVCWKPFASKPMPPWAQSAVAVVIIVQRIKVRWLLNVLECESVKIMTDKSWLAILDQATSYRELQQVFSQMATEASTNSEPLALAASIDEAIRRIEQERARDSSELDAFAAEYDAFKSQQSGIIGWFKRKLPFTETRKQELKHRGSVDEQKAEVLADNFVIARAQMLKERIVPSSSRRTGLKPHEWRDNLHRHESIEDIRVYGNLINSLGQEISSARLFTESVRVEINAFSEAIFADKQDRTQRDDDLRTARGDVKLLEDEITDKEGLRTLSLNRLAALIHDELMCNDPEYRTLISRADQLKGVTQHFAKLAKVVEEFHGQLNAVCGKLGELHAIPAKRDSLDKQLHKMQAEFKDSEFQRTCASDAVREPSRLYESASRELSNTKAALEAAKRIYDAYLAEQSNSGANRAEVTSDFEFEGTSPVVAEYGRLKNAFSQAEENLKRVTSPYENAKRTLDQLTQQTNSVRKRIDETHSEQKKLDDQESQLTKQVGSARDSASRVNAAMRPLLQTHAGNLQGISWLENSRFLIGVSNELVEASSSRDILPDVLPWTRKSPTSGKSNELVEYEAQRAGISNFEKTLKSDKAIADKDLANLLRTRKETLLRRCQLLVDNNIANEMHFK